MTLPDGSIDRCKLCAPDAARVVARLPSVSVLMPRGEPVAPGQLLVAAADHSCVFIDSHELSVIQNVIASYFSMFWDAPCLLLEHGLSSRRPHSEPHCTHAHRSFIPLDIPANTLAAMERHFTLAGMVVSRSSSIDTLSVETLRSGFEYFAIGYPEDLLIASPLRPTDEPRLLRTILSATGILGQESVNWDAAKSYRWSATERDRARDFICRAMLGEG